MSRLLIFLFVVSGSGFAADSHRDLSGKFGIGGETIIDPPQNEPKNTHIYFSITGEAAKEMIFMIKSNAVRDICLDDGTVTKFAKNIQCQFDPDRNRYACYFSVGVYSNEIGPGIAC